MKERTKTLALGLYRAATLVVLVFIAWRIWMLDPTYPMERSVIITSPTAHP